MEIQAKVIKDRDENNRYTFAVTMEGWSFYWIRLRFKKLVTKHTVMGPSGTKLWDDSGLPFETTGIHFWKDCGREVGHDVALACVAARRVYESRDNKFIRVPLHVVGSTT